MHAHTHTHQLHRTRHAANQPVQDNTGQWLQTANMLNTHVHSSLIQTADYLSFPSDNSGEKAHHSFPGGQGDSCKLQITFLA